MIEIYVVDENIWYLDEKVRDGLVMLDLLMCIKVIRVHMNVGLDLIVHCGVIMLMNNVSLLCNVYVPLIECWKYKLLMKLCDTWIEQWNCGIEFLEVYVVDENILQCICALAWVCDAWNGKWNCDIWFALIYGRNLCKYDWWHWIEMRIIWCCDVLWKDDN